MISDQVRSFFSKNWFLVCALASVLVVVATRMALPVLLENDSPVIFECAWRWSLGLGLTSSLFIEHPLNLADEPIYPTLTWWAPGAPLTLGLLLKLGFEQELSYRIYMLGTVLIGWAGWLAIARKYLSEFLSKNIFAGLIFSLLPLHFTPMRDPDEMAGWALLPWIAYSFAGILSTKWLVASVICGILSAVSIFYRNSCLHYVAVASFSMLFLPVTWKKKLLLFFIICGPSTLMWLTLDAIVDIAAEYLNSEPDSWTKKLFLFSDAMFHAGLVPILSIVYQLLPGNLSRDIKEYSDGYVDLVWINWFIWTALAVFIFSSCLKLRIRYPQLASLVFLLFSLVISFPLFLALVTISIDNSYYLTRNVMYYNILSVCWFFIGIILIASIPKQGNIINFLTKIFSIYLIILSALALFSNTSKARKNIIGYHYKAKKFGNERLSFFLISRTELQTNIFREIPPGIVYTETPYYYTMLFPELGHKFRPLPYRTVWQKIYASKPVILYFITQEDSMPVPPDIFRVTARGKNNMAPIHELKLLPGWTRLPGTFKQHGKTCVLYRADIPAGWRGESLFNQEELSREEEAPSEQFTDAVVQ